MVLLGTIVNAAAIIAGSVAGWFLPKLSKGMERTVVQGIGLALCVLGFMTAMKTEQYLWMVVSLAAGGVIGEWAQVERRFEQAGSWLERKVMKGGHGEVGKAFVAASLVFCIGAMAILGAIESGVRGNHDILLTKALMDGLLALMFTSAFGIGVIFSAAAVFAYQGLLTLAAAWVTAYVPASALETIVIEVSAVGGVLIIGIGVNLLEIKQIHVASLLPSVVVMAIAMVFITVW